MKVDRGKLGTMVKFGRSETREIEKETKLDFED
jgi:hypothetical protein